LCREERRIFSQIKNGARFFKKKKKKKEKAKLNIFIYTAGFCAVKNHLSAGLEMNQINPFFTLCYIL
jgi:hypothetical protein